MAQLRELAGARERELDLLEFELSEIEAAAPDQREHDELLGARERLRRLDALCRAAAAGVAGARPRRRRAARCRDRCSAAPTRSCEALDGVDPRLDAMAERLRALAIESGDLAAELRAYAEAPEPERVASRGSRSTAWKSAWRRSNG